MPTTDPNCHRTLLALPWLLNGSLEPEERRAVREHLIACPECRAELARTRELLAAFQAERQAAPAAAVAPVGRVVAFRRAALGRAPAHRLAWAAMIAAILASGVGVWQASRGGERAAQAAPTAAPTAVIRPERATAPREVISQLEPEGGSSARRQTASIEPAAVESKPAAPAPAVAARRPHRAVERPAPQPVVISSMGFEGGDLGEWQ